jgi:hypothetical protein
MTVRNVLEKMLVDKGMFESQAKEVIDLSIPKLNELVGGYQIKMDLPSNHYDEQFYNILYGIIKPIALTWIDNNKPMAWFREMFV